MSFNYAYLFDSLIILYRKSGSQKQRKILLDEIRSNLDYSSHSIPRLVRLSWALGFDELKETISHMATLSPDEIEDERGSMHGGKSVSNKGRLFHEARKVSAIWHEEHAYTKACLMLYYDSYYRAFDPEEQVIKDRIVNELIQLKADLSQAQWIQLNTLTDESEAVLKRVRENYVY